MSDPIVLVGSTGFVGSSLMRSMPVDLGFHSTDIDDIRGTHCSLLMLAGLPAAKWLANQDPATDQRTIARLASALDDVTADETILISTVDVYPDPTGVSEETPIERAALQAYGAHRLGFEDFARQRFPRLRIIRLPGLFGPRLRKNVIYDLLNDNRVEAIDPRAIFQWYDITRLPRDIERVRDLRRDVQIVNVTSEPIVTAELVAQHFPGTLVGLGSGQAAQYDVRSDVAAVMGGRDGYWYDRSTILSDLGAFVAGVREGRIECGSPFRTSPG